MKLLTFALIGYSLYEILSSLPRIAAHAPAGPASVAAFGLWLTFGIQVLVSGGVLLVPRAARSLPQIVHFGARRFSDYTPEQRERLMPLLRSMVGAMSVALNLFCVFLIRWQTEAVLSERPVTPGPVLWLAGGLLGALAAITWYYLDRFDEVAEPPEI